MEINFLPKLFSFSGRKRCGKTELAKICKEYGYEILNFADPMKNLICKVLNISREELEENKDKKQSIKFSENDIILLSNETDINIEIYKQNIEFNSIREILQTLGTDIIRKNNPEWHINKIKEIIENMENINKKYCFGDTRFKNEKEFLENLGAECWFIIRPNNFNISNHISEMELTWSDFNRNILINNEDLFNFRQKWIRYLNLHLKEYSNKNYFLNDNNVKNVRNKLIYVLNNYDINDIERETRLRRTQIRWLCNKLFIYLFEEYNGYIFQNVTFQNCYLFGQLESNGYIKRDKKCSIIFEHENSKLVNNFKKSLNIKRKMKKNKKNQKFSIECHNELIIENLKKWDLKYLITQ